MLHLREPNIECSFVNSDPAFRYISDKTCQRMSLQSGVASLVVVYDQKDLLDYQKGTGLGHLCELQFVTSQYRSLRSRYR